MLSAGVKEGLEAYIIREDGIRFTEHQVIHTEATADKPSTTSCFLESEEGSTFTIVIDTRLALARHPRHDWKIDTYVDGRRISKLVRKKGSLGTTRLSKVEKPFHRFIFDYRTRPVLEVMDVIAPTKHQTPPRGNRRKRNQPDLYEDYDDDDDDEAGDEVVDAKPRSREAVLTARVADLERQVERLSKRPRMLEVEEVIDLTGND